MDFPDGLPLEYYPRLRPLNFTERTGYGALGLIWPIIQFVYYSLYCLLLDIIL